MPPAVFHYDLMSPYAYLAAERLDRVLSGPVRSWALGDHERRHQGMAEIERRASEYGLPPVRWPEQWPTSSLAAMRVTIHARRAGREREFAAAAFSTAFVDGLDLGELGHVLAAAEAAGLDPRQVEAAVEDASVKDELRAETDAAHARGVFGVPTIAVGEDLFWGDDRLEDAAAAMSGELASG
jgi:2-hydroxychromene-2-carboxylate isomerase